jgi:hypothetical protein
MIEDVFFGPARHIEGGAIRQEAETGFRQSGPAFPRQEPFHLGHEAMEVQNIGCRIIHLFGGQGRRTPIRGLLLFGDFDPEHFPAQIFEAVAVGIGACQARGGPGAIHRGAADAQIAFDHAQVKAGEMEDFEDRCVGQKRGQAGRRCAGDDLNEMGMTVAGGNLHQAEPVAVQLEAGGFGINSNAAREGDGSEIAAMEMICHVASRPIAHIARDGAQERDTAMLL